MVRVKEELGQVAASEWKKMLSGSCHEAAFGGNGSAQPGQASAPAAAVQGGVRICVYTRARMRVCLPVQ